MKKSEVQAEFSFLVKESGFRKKGSVYIRQFNDEVVQSIYIRRLGKYEFDLMIGIYPALAARGLECFKGDQYVPSDFTRDMEDDGWYFETGREEEIWEECRKKSRLLKERIVPEMDRIDAIHELALFQDRVFEWYEIKYKDDSIGVTYPWGSLITNLYDGRYETAKKVLEYEIRMWEDYIDLWEIEEYSTPEEKEEELKRYNEEIADVERIYEAIEKKDEEMLRGIIFYYYDESMEEMEKLGFQIEKKLKWPRA